MSLVSLVAVFFAMSTALIALFAEVSKLTPYSSKHSLIRGIICIGCIVFSGIAMSQGYEPNAVHALMTTFIFLISCVQFRLETTGKTINDVIRQLEDRVHITSPKN